MRLSLILLSLQLWGNVEVSSSEIACSVLPDVPHAHISEETKKVQYQGGHVIHFTCEPGYFTSVSTIRYVCSSEGWLAVQKETCSSPLGCGKPPSLEDGDTKETLRSQYRQGERVEYICQRLYTMEGEPYKTCFNSEWIGQMRCLKPCTVDQQAMDTHNIEFTYRNEPKLYSVHNDVISFSCKGRRRPVGTLSMRQWCNNGVIHLPTCH